MKASLSPPPMQNPHLDATPFFYEGNDTGVLLLHGFTATPVEVRPLGKFLHQHGYTVSGPRLPGHGTTPQDLNRCAWQDWVEHARQAYHELTSRCRQVFVGGESMGGLLTLYLGSEYSEIAGLLTYAPAVRLASRLVILAPLLRHFIKTVNKPAAGQDPDVLVNQRWQGYTVYPVPALAQLLELQRQVRRRLPQVTSPLLIFQGRLDTTLDPFGAEYVLDRAGSQNKELVWMEQSTHVLLLDVEWETAAERSLSFIQQYQTGNQGESRAPR